MSNLAAKVVEDASRNADDLATWLKGKVAFYRGLRKRPEVVGQLIPGFLDQMSATLRQIGVAHRRRKFEEVAYLERKLSELEDLRRVMLTGLYHESYVKQKQQYDRTRGALNRKLKADQKWRAAAIAYDRERAVTDPNWMLRAKIDRAITIKNKLRLTDKNIEERIRRVLPSRLPPTNR
jgi:hypothetical protein